MKIRWKRLREATAVASGGTLLREDAIDGDPEDEESEVQPCPGCDGTGIKGAGICSQCGGAGALVKESTNGPYWVYSDDPEWDQLREADHPQWEEMQEAPRTFSSDVRKKYAGSGVAQSDGSYPIPDADALDRAIKAFGRNATAAVKTHIIKRASALGLTSKLPEGWGSSKEAAKAGFGGKKAPLFGKDAKDDEDEDAKDKKSKESIASLEERLGNMEEDMDVFRQLREAKPASMATTFSTPTQVTTSTGKKGYRVILIREGKGNKEDDQWYTEDSIRELCESGVAEGMQAYGNHPDLEEEELRPERDVKELVGSYHDVKFVKEGNKARAEAVFVPLTLDENHPRYGWVVTLAEAAANSTAPQPICGISLYGLSGGDDGERPDGSFGRMVNIVRPSSGDIVTSAGAGGGFIRQIMESARALRNKARKELTPMEAMAYQRAVREATKRVREADSDEARVEALAALETLESEKIDSVPDNVSALREAAPGLVEEIETSIKADASGEVEELKTQLREAQGLLGKFTDAFAITDHLREAGVENPVELRHYASEAQRRGYTEAGEIKEMVEADKAYIAHRRAEDTQALREALSLDEDAEVEGFGGRIPTVALPTDGGVDTLRESGLPIAIADAE